MLLRTTQGIGYLDEEDEEGYSEEGLSNAAKRKKDAKDKEAKKKAKLLPQSNKITSMLKKQRAGGKKKKAAVVDEDEVPANHEDFMDNIMGELEAGGGESLPDAGLDGGAAARPSRRRTKGGSALDSLDADLGIDKAEIPLDFKVPQARRPQAARGPASSVAAAADAVAASAPKKVKIEPGLQDDMMAGLDAASFDFDGGAAPVAEKKVAPKINMASYVAADGFSAAKSATAGQAAQVTATSQGALQDDGSIVMWWYDAYENKYNDPGTVYLFGKTPVTDPATGKGGFASCVMKVSDIDRNMYVVARKTIRGTDTPVKVADFEDDDSVFSEFTRKMERHGLQTSGRIKATSTQRFFTFQSEDCPVDKGVHECLKYKAPPKVKEMPEDVMSGRSYSHVFGAETTALEQLIIRRKIMGPCWLKFEAPEANTHGKFSSCQLEFMSRGIKSVSVAMEHRDTDPPPLRVMTLSMRTIYNEKKKTSEIVMLGAMTHDGMSVDGPTENFQENLAPFCLLTPPPGSVLPLEFQEKVKALNAPVTAMPTERALLNNFFARLHRFDPDVLVAHNLVAFDLELLISRAAVHKCSTWDRIGRLKRSQIPKIKSGQNLGQYAAGRLLMDTYLSSKELVKQTTFTLTALAEKQMDMKREEIEAEHIARHYFSADQLLGLAQQTCRDARIVLMLMCHLQCLPLSKQLTCLCGNLWSRTLKGARAERNEYLLMHEFYRNTEAESGAKYILPDKKGWKKPANKVPGSTDDPERRRAGQSGRKKAAYAGGLVLEPKKGFYDQMIVLLDFNSLYPSIIREYNICFTTVVAPKEDEEDDSPEKGLPSVPASDAPPGILPAVIKTLLERRRAVKKFLKQENDPVKRQQLDIRQMALKLTANSMYGCLGFSSSRFYAKSMAQLVTHQGRSILMKTKEITENTLGLEVVYGDTDSIMVNMRTQNFSEAIQKGEKVKKEINGLYDHLELEIDGVFKTALFMKKKKYAAVTIENKGGKLVTARETKGLDMVRRDWCPISKEISGYVLDQILGRQNREEVVEAIHSHMTKVGENIEKQPLAKFIITKVLTKMPHEYPDARNQPHVQVALQMMRANIRIQAGMTIEYLVVKNEGAGSSGIADRVMSPKDFQGNPSAALDYTWYKSNQIHPPINRLCDCIEGTDAAQLASCLGLDSSKFTTTIRSDMDSQAAQLIPGDNEERFKNCNRLQVTCGTCGEDSAFDGLDADAEGKELRSGLSCKKAGCHGFFSDAYLQNVLTLGIREEMTKYYESPFVCEDPSCRHSCKDVSLAGLEDQGDGHVKCSVFTPGCEGKMFKRHSSNNLYTQLLYFSYVFDHAKQLETLQRKYPNPLPVLNPSHQTSYNHCKQIADRFKVHCQYRYLNLGELASALQSVSAARAKVITAAATGVTE